MDDNRRRLMCHGVFLFLLGLLTGFAEPHFANMRMGLAAHLEGVMNGILLIALGAIWNEILLSPRLKAGTFSLAMLGTYGNWLVTTSAAVFGTAALSPITGAGHTGQPWQEAVVTAGFMLIGLAIVVTSILCLVGLRRRA